MYPSRSQSLLRRMNRNISTIIICGIFFFFTGLVYLSMCNLPCERVKENPVKKEELIKQPANEKDESQDALQANWPLWDFPKPQGKLQAFLIILIMSSPGGIKRRDAIRETWLSEHAEDVQPFFVIGAGGLAHEISAHLQHENDHEHDLLLLKNLNDSYYALTEKLIESLAWLDRHVDYKFVMKADDDTFARMDIITKELRQREAKMLYWGFFDGRARVKKSGQWAESEWVLCDTYLPHARGGGYFISSDLAHYVASNAKYLKRYKSEDISMGAWLGAVNVNRVHDTRFDTEYASRGCFNSFIITHKQGVLDMQAKHKRLKESEGQVMCENEVRIRKSYVYNWKVPPSQCCIRNDTSVT